jgi:hypothetical protein
MNVHTVTLLIAAGALTACAQTAPNWESRFGDSVRQSIALQVIDPNAPSRNTGPMRTDGKAASGAMKGYADSFGYAVKEKQPEITLAPAASR